MTKPRIEKLEEWALENRLDAMFKPVSHRLETDEDYISVKKEAQPLIEQLHYLTGRWYSYKPKEDNKHGKH